MKKNTLKTRGVVFAYLVGPPRLVSREEASSLHGKVCDALRLDDIQFAYRPKEAQDRKSKGFSVEMVRVEGRGGLAVGFENVGSDSPCRLLLTYDFPPSLEHVKESFDTVAGAILDSPAGASPAGGSPSGGWKRVLAEARIRAECAAEGERGLDFVRDRLLRFRTNWLDTDDGPLGFASVTYRLAAMSPGDPEHLEGPRRELRIEPLREDERELYLELVSTWEQLAKPPNPGGFVDHNAIRRIDQPPSAYIGEGYRFLEERVLSQDWTRKG